MATALLVDGVFNVREMVVKNDPPDIRFPIALPMRLDRFDDCTAPISYTVEIFTRIGRLPDERVIYGLDRLGLKLWYVRGSWTRESVVETPDVKGFVRDEMVRKICALVVGKYLTFYDRTVEDAETGVFTNMMMGVGRSAR